MAKLLHPESPERLSATGTPTGLASTWSPTRRAIASALILFHLTAVFWAPFTFACSVGNGSSSPFADGVMSWLRPYIGLMYLDHGYFFFAPNPGPSHLVHYKVEFDDGRKPIEGTFPNLNDERPRLLYHRHFMLAEALQASYIPSEAPSPPPLVTTGLSSDERRDLEKARQEMVARETALWTHRREQYTALRNSFEKHLLAKHGGSRVTITRQEHLLLSPDEFLRLGRRLDLPQTLRNLPESLAPEVIRP